MSFAVAAMTATGASGYALTRGANTDNKAQQAMGIATTSLGILNGTLATVITPGPTHGFRVHAATAAVSAVVAGSMLGAAYVGRELANSDLL